MFVLKKQGGTGGAASISRTTTTSTQEQSNPFAQKQQQESLMVARQREDEARRRESEEKEERERAEYERQKLAKPTNMMRSTDVSDKDLFEAELIKDLMDSYFSIVRRNVLDTVPKSIMFYLVNDSKNRVQNELVEALYKENLFAELLEEGPQVASRRQACSKMLDVLKRAHVILNEVRDMSVIDGSSQDNNNMSKSSNNNTFRF
jgi:hypothetical protein